MIADDGRRHSYGELFAACNQLSHGFGELGLRRGDCVLTTVNDGLEFLEIYFAAMQSGIYLLPVKCSLTAAELTYLLHDSGASAVIAGLESHERVTMAAEAAGVPSARRLATAMLAGFTALSTVKLGNPSSIPAERSGGDVLLYTSGTTGQRKGVLRPLPADGPPGACTADALSPTLHVTQSFAGPHLNFLPFCHRGSIGTTTGAIQLGRSVVLARKPDALRLLHLIDMFEVASVMMPPDVILRLLDLPDHVRDNYDLTSLNAVFHGSGPLPRRAKDALMQWLGPIVWSVYSSTEGVFAYCSPEDWLARPGTAGRPPATTDIRILSESRQPCPPGVIGEIFAHIPSERPFEYLHDAEKTRLSRDGPYFTVGDLGYVDDDGWLFLCGRRLDVINVGGSNVYAAEVEAVLLAHPLVTGAAVFGVPSPAYGEEVLALVELTKECEEPSRVMTALHELCETQLATFKRPVEIAHRERLARSDSGKIAKRLLREQYWPTAAGKDPPPVSW